MSSVADYVLAVCEKGEGYGLFVGLKRAERAGNGRGEVAARVALAEFFLRRGAERDRLVAEELLKGCRPKWPRRFDVDPNKERNLYGYLIRRYSVGEPEQR